MDRLRASDRSTPLRRRQRVDLVSLDDPAPRGAAAIIDLLESNDPRQDDLLSLVEEAGNTLRRLRAALECLDERERLVIELHLLAEPAISLKAAGQRLGCGGVRARQLEQRALGKLRACLEGCGDGSACRLSPRVRPNGATGRGAGPAP